MKKITLLFLIILFSVTSYIHAQKTFAGEIRFETKIEGTDDPNLLASIEKLVQTVTILGNKSKTILKDEMASLTQIWDGDKETASKIFEITGMGKYYKKWNKDELKEKSKFNDYSYTYEEDYKTICDYKCQKVIVMVTNMEDDSQKEIMLYVTKEIGSSKLNGNQFIGLEGYPLMSSVMYEEYCEGCTIVTQATKITPKKIKDVDFLLPDDGIKLEDIDDPELKEFLEQQVFGDK